MAAPKPEDPIESARMTLGEHLDELRKRLVRGFAVLIGTFLLGFGFYQQIDHLLTWPFHQAVQLMNESRAEELRARLLEHPETPPATYFVEGDVARGELVEAERAEERLIATGPMEGFNYSISIAVYFALFTGLPFLLYELWQFVSAGLYRHERKAVLRYLPYSIGLFVVGMVFSFVWCVPYVLYYLGVTFPIEKLKPQWRVSEYFDVLSTMCLGMGLLFQLPVVMVFVMRVGLVEPKTFAKYRRHFILAAFIIAAILSPPDFYSTAVMAIPMIVLYELGILIGRWVYKPRETPGSYQRRTQP